MNEFLEATDWLSQRKVMTVEQSIVENLDRLRDLLPHTWSDESFDDILQLMVEKVARGKLTSDLIHSWWSYVVPPQANVNAGAFLISLGCTLLARNELEQGQLENAWPLITHAAYCCGMVEGLSARKYGIGLDGQASNGGHAKAARLQPLKQEVIRQLQDPPAGGWGNLLATAIEIECRLAPFLAANPNIVRPSDLCTSVERWLKDDTYNAPVRQAYLSNRAEPRSRRAPNP
jgi:hypothetical protein